MDKFAVIGLGDFGSILARTLAQAGKEILAVDSSREEVELVRNEVSVAVRLDSTDERALREQGVDKVDAAIVSIGENFEGSVLTTALLKSMGVKTVISRAQNPVQARILSLIGADEVINPEEESAFRLSQRLISPRVVDYLELADGYSMVQVSAPRSFHNKRIVDIDLRKKHNINLVAIKKRNSYKSPNGETIKEDRIKGIPKPSDVIEPEDILVLIGSKEDLSGLPQD